MVDFIGSTGRKHSKCLECRKAYHRITSKRWHVNNKEQHATAMRKWFASRTLEQRAARYARHEHWVNSLSGDRKLEYEEMRKRCAKAWNEKNKAHRKIVQRKWLEANWAHFTAMKAKRRAQKYQASPAWANNFFISEIYDLARRRTKLWGVKMEVDHIVPLQHPLVCGLHVEHNLQIIPKTANCGKRNLWWPDMPTDGVQHGTRF